MLRFLGKAYERAFVAPSQLRASDAAEAGLDYSDATDQIVELAAHRGLRFSFLWTLRRSMVGYLLVGAVLVVFASAMPPAITRAVAALSDEGGNSRRVWWPLTALGLLAIGFALARWTLTWRARDLQLRASLLIQRVVFHRLQRVDPVWLGGQERSTSSLLITWPDQVSQLVFLAEFVVYSVLIIVLASQLIVTFGVLGAVVMALIATATGALRPLGRLTVRLAVNYLELDHGRSRLIDDLSRQRRQVRRGGLLVPLTLTLQRLRAPQLRLLRRRAWASGTYDAILDSLPVLFAAVLLVVAQLSGGAVASAKLAAVLVASRMIVSAISECLITARVVQSGNECARSIDELIRAAPNCASGGDLPAGAIRIIGPEMIDIPPGTRVAVTGPGAASLLRTVVHGDMAKHGGSVQWVARDHRPFDGTVADVVTLWSMNVPERRYLDALQRSGLLAELAGRERGDGTMLSSSARVLSDGQSVRLGLAQALCHESDILVLEDIFAPLDPVNAEHVAQQLLMPGEQTIVYSTSRPELLDYADLILDADDTVISRKPAKQKAAVGPIAGSAVFRRSDPHQSGVVVAAAFDNHEAEDHKPASVAELIRLIFGVPAIVSMTLAAAAGILGEMFIAGYDPAKADVRGRVLTYGGAAAAVLIAYLVRHVISYRGSIAAVDGLHQTVTKSILRPDDTTDPAAIAGRLGRDFATAESQAPRVLSLMAIGIMSLLISVGVVALGAAVTLIPSALLCGGLALAYVRSRAATQAALQLSAAARAPLTNFAVASIGYIGFHVNPAIREALFDRFNVLAALRAVSSHRLQWVRLRLLMQVELIGAGFFVACAWAAPFTSEIIAPGALVYIAYSLSQQVITVVERAQSGEIASRQVDRVLALLHQDAPSHHDLLRAARPGATTTSDLAKPGPVELRGLTVETVEDNRTPAPLTATLPAGSLTWVEGPSGIGKSVLLETIAGLTAPRRGSVAAPPSFLVDSDVPDLPILISAMADDAALDQVFDAVERPRPRKDQPVNQLPQTDRQLVAIARALHSRAPLILLDEATSSQSLANERRVLDLFHQSHRSIIVVSHRPDNRDLADSTIRLVPARDPRTPGTAASRQAP